MIDGEDVRDRIVRLVRLRPNGAWARRLAKELGVSHQTLQPYLRALVKEGVLVREWIEVSTGKHPQTVRVLLYHLPEVEVDEPRSSARSRTGNGGA